MNKAAAFVVLGSTLILTLSLARAHSDSPRPEGVAPNAWIPLTADAGFVVTGNNSQMVRLGGERPAVTGYLVARHDGKWVRLEPQGDGQILPAN
jgi:hypothetical protein